MLKNLKKLSIGLSAALVLPLLALAPAASAESSTVTVTQSNSADWIFNGDPNTATDYEFSEAAFSIGEGSLYVPPIGGTPSDKFIAILPMGIPVNELASIGYDFKVAGNGDATDANKFYLNVYTNTVNSENYYDCRFDFVPTSGSTTEFTAASFSSTTAATNVAGTDCPASKTLADMAAGSTVSFFALNVGDTSTDDEGLAGYLDKVVVTAGADTTTYDFEQDPVTLTNKDQCKKDGWRKSENPVYKNQGDCVSAFASQGRSGGNPIMNFLRSL